MVMIEERFSDHCDMCGASSNAGLFAVFNTDDKNSKIHICPDCIEGISKSLDEMIVNTVKFGKSIRDFFRPEQKDDIEKYYEMRKRNLLYGHFGKISEDLRSGKLKIEDLKFPDLSRDD